MGFFHDFAAGLRKKQDQRYEKTTAESDRYSAARAKAQAEEHLRLAREALEEGDDDEAIRQSKKAEEMWNLHLDIQDAMLSGKKW